ncbi:hypothetical protein KFL_010240010 [Klebsormidium nitens]|uniref:Uncharacterized protein n=1 Tax=Klebsormidium nitens TaxID=105231 RepID=A0A1Y1IW27_KLENI|nr:hypothetical protein KFL_010240010 [Klebsormidium nitens]|eukprot:GAQ92478.1 hypothetical protein KFL_010240010 [Klebsormidium nitens]
MFVVDLRRCRLDTDDRPFPGAQLVPDAIASPRNIKSPGRPEPGTPTPPPNSALTSPPPAPSALAFAPRQQKRLPDSAPRSAFASPRTTKPALQNPPTPLWPFPRSQERAPRPHPQRPLIAPSLDRRCGLSREQSNRLLDPDPNQPLASLPGNQVQLPGPAPDCRSTSPPVARTGYPDPVPDRALASHPSPNNPAGPRPWLPDLAADNRSGPAPLTAVVLHHLRAANDGAVIDAIVYLSRQVCGHVSEVGSDNIEGLEPPATQIYQLERYVRKATAVHKVVLIQIASAASA